MKVVYTDTARVRHPVYGEVEFDYVIQVPDDSDIERGPYMGVIPTQYIEPGLLAYGATFNEVGTAIGKVTLRYVQSQLN